MKSVSFCHILNSGYENMSSVQEWKNDKEDIFVFINLTKIGLNLVKVVEVKVSKIIVLLIVIRHRSEEADIQFILVMQQ